MSYTFFLSGCLSDCFYLIIGDTVRIVRCISPILFGAGISKIIPVVLLTHQSTLLLWRCGINFNEETVLTSQIFFLVWTASLFTAPMIPWANQLAHYFTSKKVLFAPYFLLSKYCNRLWIWLLQAETEIDILMADRVFKMQNISIARFFCNSFLSKFF